MAKLRELFKRREGRVRSRLKRHAGTRLRLSVHRSGRHIYAQIIDDTKGVTLAAASTLDKDVKAAVKAGGTSEAAAAVGKAIAERGLAAKVTEVIFDRGSYLYHGRVKALADAAREGGLQF